jgi:hypothetical protein
MISFLGAVCFLKIYLHFRFLMALLLASFHCTSSLKASLVLYTVSPFSFFPCFSSFSDCLNYFTEWNLAKASRQRAHFTDLILNTVRGARCGTGYWCWYYIHQFELIPNYSLSLGMYWYSEVLILLLDIQVQKCVFNILFYWNESHIEIVLTLLQGVIGWDPREYSVKLVFVIAVFGQYFQLCSNATLTSFLIIPLRIIYYDHLIFYSILKNKIYSENLFNSSIESVSDD